MSVFEKLRDCVYLPDMDFPERTNPHFDALRAEFEAQEQIGVEALKADLLAEHGLTDNKKATVAFEIAYRRESSAGLHAVVALFEDLLPLIVVEN